MYIVNRHTLQINTIYDELHPHKSLFNRLDFQPSSHASFFIIFCLIAQPNTRISNIETPNTLPSDPQYIERLKQHHCEEPPSLIDGNHYMMILPYQWLLLLSFSTPDTFVSFPSPFLRLSFLSQVLSPPPFLHHL